MELIYTLCVRSLEVTKNRGGVVSIDLPNTSRGPVFRLPTRLGLRNILESHEIDGKKQNKPQQIVEA